MPGVTSLTGRVEVKINWDYRFTPEFDAGDSPPIWVKTMLSRLDFEVSGDDTGQVDRLFAQRRTVTSSTTTDDLDLSGTLLDIYGKTLDLEAVKLVAIFNQGTLDGDNLLIGGAGAGNNAWGAPWGGDQDSQSICCPGVPYMWGNKFTGILLTPGSQDTLRITHDGISAEIDYDIVVMGTAINNL